MSEQGDDAIHVAALSIAHRSAVNHYSNMINARIAGMCSIKDERAAEANARDARVALESAIQWYRAKYPGKAP